MHHLRNQTSDNINIYSAMQCTPAHSTPPKRHYRCRYSTGKGEINWNGMQGVCGAQFPRARDKRVKQCGAVTERSLAALQVKREIHRRIWAPLLLRVLCSLAVEVPQSTQSGCEIYLIGL
jgi:hypothetical protein